MRTRLQFRPSIRALLPLAVGLLAALSFLAGSAGSASAAIPATPTGVTVQIVQTSVYLRWQKNAETGITGYQMYRQKPDGTWTTAGVASGAIYLLSNLTSGLEYTYRLTAINSEGNQSLPSAPVSFTPRDTIAPPVLTGLTATPGDSQIHVAWGASTAPDIGHYLVYRLNPGGSWPTSATAATTSPSFTDIGLSDGTSYTYRIMAVDQAGNESPASATITATPRDTTPPAPPAEPAAQSGEESKVDLTWTASADPRFAHYAIYRENTEGAWPAAPAAVSPTAAFSDTGVEDGRTYSYRLVTVDHAGSEYIESAPSATVSGTPKDATPPAAPESAAAQSGEESRVSLSWSPSSDLRLDHYALYRENADGTWPATPTATISAAGSPPGPWVTFTDLGLVDGVTYSYRVVSVDHVGTEYVASLPSAIATGTPKDTAPPGPPDGLTAQSGEESKVDLTWNASATTDTRFDHYAIYRQSPEGTWPTSPTAASSTPNLTDSSLSDGTAYVYRVASVDLAGTEYVESAPSEPVAATPKDATPPPAPEGLAAQSQEDGQVTLSWTASTDLWLDHYAIYRQNADGTWPTTPTSLLSSATAGLGLVSYVDTGLSDGTTYSYRVTAVDHAGGEYVESAPSSVVSATPSDNAPPSAPEGLTAASGEDSRVTLAWSGSTDPRLDHYAIYRQEPEGTWPTSPTATSPTPAFVDTSLSDGTTYSYRIAAVDQVGAELLESPPSEVATATPKDTTLPAAPEGVTAQSGEESKVDLSWTASSDARFDHYAIYRENSEGNWPTSPTATSATASFTHEGLSDGTAYSYRVIAVDKAGSEEVESAPSEVASATPKDTTPPSPPEGLTAQSGEESKTYVSWTASTDPRFDHYAIYRENSEGNWPTSPTAESSSPVFTDTGLTDGTTYSYRVSTVDRAGSEYVESAPSPTVTATPRDITPPAAPTELSVTGGNEQNTLSWVANTEPDLDHYAIYRENANGTWPSTPLSTTSSTSYVDSQVIGGTEYTYRLTALDHNGNESAPSATASATPTETSPPAPPAQPVITGGEGQLGISWPLNHEYDVTHYAVYRAERNGSWPAAPLGETTHNWWTDHGLVNGTAYEYRIVAIDHAGLPSPASNSVQGTPAPVPITNPGTLFSGASPWNEPIEAGAPANPNSQLMMSGIEPSTGRPASGSQGGLLASIAKSGTSLEAYSGYSSPMYVVPANQPLVPVHVIEPTVVNHIALEQVLSQGVPIPPNAQSAAGTDGHLTIYQPSTETLWDLWRACSPEGPNNQESWVAAQSCPSTPAATWTVQYGGVMRNAAQSLGYFDTNSDPGFSGYFWGSTATSLPVAAGMVTMSELQAGQINHALALDIPGYGLPGAVCAYNNWHLPNDMGVTPIAWPAQRSDGTYFGPDCIPEGARLRIEPGFNLNSITLPKVARMFAVAAQKYGMVVRDRDAGGVSFFAEDPVSLRQEGVPLDPYTGQVWTNAGSSPTAGGLLAGAPTWSLFKNFPWSHVQVMSATICHAKLAPCPSSGD